MPQQKLPPECLLPMLLVGPGTGVAPMRSVMRQRLHIKARTGASDTDFGCAMLFFGCRKKESDYLYEDEWNELLPADHSRHGLRFECYSHSIQNAYLLHNIFL